MEEKKRYLMGMGGRNGWMRKSEGKKIKIKVVSGTHGYDVRKFTK